MKSIKWPWLFISLSFFGLIYSLISFFNHYLFRTYALDLGLYTNALYKYSRLIPADSALFKEINEYLLGDHFDLYLPLFSPLVYLFGTYTLLIVQIASILAGGYGVYRYFKLINPDNQLIQLVSTLSFLTFFGVFSAISFDYHSNVVAAMLVPWLFFFSKKKNFLVSTIFLLAILIAKENMALWVIFICLGMAVEYWKDKRSLAWLLAFTVFSGIYFMVILNVVMPWIASSGKYNGFSYTSLGQSPWDALSEIIFHPLESFKMLFTNHLDYPYGNYVKTELHILVLISGLYFLFLKPRYLIMLIPIYFQKMFHDSTHVWGISGQYSIEFAPVLAIGVFTVISEFKNKKIERLMSLMVFIGVLFATVRIMDRTVLYTDKAKIRFYQSRHYNRNYDVKPVYSLLKSIPSDAAVSAQSPFVPHLALRNKIYQFPLIKDAEYIVISDQEDKFPLKDEKYFTNTKMLLESGEWEEITQHDVIRILKKTNTPGTND